MSVVIFISGDALGMLAAGNTLTAMAAAAKKLTNLDTFIIFLLTLETADRL
jgi:hypothetical protein